MGLADSPCDAFRRLLGASFTPLHPSLCMSERAIKNHRHTHSLPLSFSLSWPLTHTRFLSFYFTLFLCLSFSFFPPVCLCLTLSRLTVSLARGLFCTRAATREPGPKHRKLQEPLGVQQRTASTRL